MIKNEYAIVFTDKGKEKIMQAQITDEPVKLEMMAIGDGKNAPNPSQTALQNEVARVPINRIAPDKTEKSRIVVESVIPPELGGWYIREVGLIDTEGDLIAISKYPESWKPSIDSGTAKESSVTFILELVDTDCVALDIDPHSVLVTQAELSDRLESFMDGVREVISPQDEINKDFDRRISMLELAVERIMIEWELDEKIKEGYAFYNALDGMDKGMHVVDYMHYIADGFLPSVEVLIPMYPEYREGDQLIIYDNDNFEYLDTKSHQGQISITTTKRYPNGAMVVRSAAKIDPSKREIIPIPYVTSEIESELV